MRSGEQSGDRRSLRDRCDGGGSEPLSADDATRGAESRRDASGATTGKETKVLNGGLTPICGSAETGKIGADPRILEELTKNGIKYVIH